MSIVQKIPGFPDQNLQFETNYIHQNSGQTLKFTVRYLSSNDSSHEVRGQFLEQIFGHIATRAFSDDESYFLSRILGEYEILVIGGVDPMRMCRHVRANKPILNGVATIAVVGNSTPSRRARLLNSGFDEVIDITRTSVDESKARIVAVMSRYQQKRRSSVPFRKNRKPWLASATRRI